MLLLRHVRGDERLELRHIHIHHYTTLWQFLDPCQRSGTLGFATQRLLNGLGEFGGQRSFKADHFNIYRSILKPQGAVYTVLQTIALREMG